EQPHSSRRARPTSPLWRPLRHPPTTAGLHPNRTPYALGPDPRMTRSSHVHWQTIQNVLSGFLIPSTNLELEVRPESIKVVLVSPGEHIPGHEKRPLRHRLHRRARIERTRSTGSVSCAHLRPTNRGPHPTRRLYSVLLRRAHRETPLRSKSDRPGISLSLLPFHRTR